MVDLSFIGNNTLLIGVGLVGAFVIWKFVMQPIMNEGKPIEPNKDDPTIEEQLKKNFNPEIDF